MTTLVPGNSRPRLLGVFAHPDDECFCAGGTLARYVAAGAEAMVVSATRGEAGQIRDPHSATRRTLGAVRAGELAQACRRLGVQHAVCLDYGDGTLKDVDQWVLTREVAQIIRTFRPDVVLTFGEDGAYGHPDHIAIGRATTTAWALAGEAACFPEQLAAGRGPHQPARLYHSRFPRQRMLFADHLVQWLVRQETRFRGAADFAQGLLLLTEETSLLGYTRDHAEVRWFPRGVSIIEQGEPATSLYLVLSGEAEVVREDAEGTTHRLARLGPGEFFGELGLADARPRNAHVVAAADVTCLVFSPAPPTTYAGRGAGAQADLLLLPPPAGTTEGGPALCLDVRDYVARKIAAIAAHRSQYPLRPDLLPLTMLQEMMGREYFVPVSAGAAWSVQDQTSANGAALAYSSGRGPRARAAASGAVGRALNRAAATAGRPRARPAGRRPGRYPALHGKVSPRERAESSPAVGPWTGHRRGLRHRTATASS
jgi:LmbE family N-acetylglucosaminyl deacetylase